MPQTPKLRNLFALIGIAILPEIDRVVSTSADMKQKDLSNVVQVWSLTDLSLIKTMVLEPGPRGNEHFDPGTSST